MTSVHRHALSKFSTHSLYTSGDDAASRSHIRSSKTCQLHVEVSSKVKPHVCASDVPVIDLALHVVRRFGRRWIDASHILRARGCRKTDA